MDIGEPDMLIDPDAWVQQSEAARLLRCSPQRVSDMIDEGLLDVLRPWDKVTLVGRRSIADWLMGIRPHPIRPRDARIWLLAKPEVTSVHDMDLPDVQDAMLEFITEVRPRWDQQRRELWALETAPKLFRMGVRQ